MSFAETNKNSAVAQQLRSLLNSGRLVHAFLFVGTKEERLQTGKALARAILCVQPVQGDACGDCPSCRKFDHGNHEEFLYLDLDTAPGSAKMQIGVDAVEHLQEQLKLKPFGKRHVVLIEEAHLLNTAAQNKLLKTLEEPAGDSVLILLAEKKDALLPTVVSRCSTYYLEDGGFEPDAEILTAVRNFFVLFAEKSLFYRKRDCVKSILEDKNDPRGKALSFLQTLESVLRDALLCPYGVQISPLCADWPAFEELCAKVDKQASERAISAVEQAIRSIRAGYNTGYTIKKLCLDLT